MRLGGATCGLLCPSASGSSGCLFPLPDFLEPARAGTVVLGARQMQFSVRFFF
jgi:hypothetical protein